MEGDPFPSSVFPSLKFIKRRKGLTAVDPALYEKDCGNGVRFLRVPIEACSKMRGAGKSSPDKAGGPAWLMRRPRALDNELYGHRRHAPLAAGGVRERMGRNARAIQEIKARLNLVDIARRTWT